MVCKIEQCKKTVLCKNYCSYHYRRVLRGISLDQPFGKTYSVNEHYFDVIDTSSSAYLLGILLTDGCVYKQKNSYGCRLEMVDEDLIKFMKHELNANYPIRFRPSTNTFSFSVCSKIMFFALGKYGIIPNKTFLTTYPQNLNKLDSHFIRGCLDGDGFIAYDKGKYPRNRIGWTGTYRLLSQIQKTLHQYCDASNKEIHINSGTRSYILCYSSKTDLEKITKYLYLGADTSFYLKRKRDKVI